MYTCSNSAMALNCIDHFWLTGTALTMACTYHTKTYCKTNNHSKMYKGPNYGHLERIILHMCTHRVLHPTSDEVHSDQESVTP